MTTTTHTSRAMEIAQSTTDNAAIARLDSPARQGDVLMRCIGKAKGKAFEAGPAGGLCVAAGAHGEHRLVCDRYRMDRPGVYSLPDGGLLVHTDVPDARHPAIRLPAGVWEFGIERELGADMVVRKVED